MGSNWKEMEGLNTNDIWDTFCNLLCPSEVKVFLWKTLHGALPCRSILANRHLKIPPQCPTCSMGFETVKHLLFECPKANELWHILGLGDAIRKACVIDHVGGTVLECLLNVLDDEVFVLSQARLKEIVATITWYLW